MSIIDTLMQFTFSRFDSIVHNSMLNTVKKPATDFSSVYMKIPEMRQE